LEVLVLRNSQGWAHPVLLTNTTRQYGSDTNTIPSGDAFYDGAGIPWYVMFREGRYKYVRALIAGELEELYDLREDPEELRNLATEPAHQERLRQLRLAAVAELRRTGAGFVDVMPAVRDPMMR
jgi:arylsulfatase A-like enzyme